jgi:hypothetical protein
MTLNKSEKHQLYSEYLPSLRLLKICMLVDETTSIIILTGNATTYASTYFDQLLQYVVIIFYCHFQSLIR